MAFEASRQLVGIASLLDDEHSAKVMALWDRLADDCGLVGIRITPLPHFSWQVAESYAMQQLDSVLKELTASCKPFTVRTTGVGVFSGENPIIFVPLVKDITLLRFHRQLWERTFPAAVGISPFYNPDSWIPHITLAYGDVRQDNLACAMSNLAFGSYNWQIRVDHLAVQFQADEGGSRPVRRYLFGA